MAETLVLPDGPDARVRRAARAARDRLRDLRRPVARPPSYICHALTGDAEAADWWDTLIGPGKPVDTDRFHVICANLLGGCKGTTGPSLDQPRDRRAVRARLPAVHGPRPRRGAPRAAARARRSSGCTRAIGGSLGGMQILQWALDHPDEIERAVLVCATARLTAQNIAFSKVARARDPRRHDAMDVARMMAHITYLSEEGMERKFDRARRVPDAGDDAALGLRGRALPRPPGRDLPRPLRPAHLPLPVAGDGLLRPVRRADRARRRTPASCSSPSTPTGASAPSTRATSTRELRALRRRRRATHEVASPWGHDSFLMDVPEYHEAVAGLLSG